MTELPEELSAQALTRTDLQREILRIERDQTLTDQQRDAARQGLFSRGYEQRKANEARHCRASRDASVLQPSYSPLVDPATGERHLGCDHYVRKCKIKAECCGLWVVCRLCHDDPSLSMDHQIDRFAIKELLCMACNTVQLVGERCVKPDCGVQFGDYSCLVCNFFDSTPGKDVYHCDKCGICRIGKDSENVHCGRCNACICADSLPTHKCIPESLAADCPICNVDMFTSTSPVVYMQCGHTMHSHCFDIYTSTNYTCPLCNKALTDMSGYYAHISELLAHEKMPAEYANHVSKISCHDCDHKSTAPYHFVYHKCNPDDGGCGGYNTRVLKTVTMNTAPDNSSEEVAGTGSSTAEIVAAAIAHDPISIGSFGETTTPATTHFVVGSDGDGSDGDMSDA
jgi:hypothetical protein